jgi:hypothetical protein
VIRYSLAELDDLLPELALGEEPTAPEGSRLADDAEVEAFLDAHTTAKYPRALVRAVEGIDDTVRRNSGARHPSLRMFLWQALSEASVGAYSAREAAEKGYAHWQRHVAGERRPRNELWGLLRWQVPLVAARTDLAKVSDRLDLTFGDPINGPAGNGHSPGVSTAGAAPESTAEPVVRFRRYSVNELLAEDRTFVWDVVGMLTRPTYGVDAGELKTLKSYFGLARAIGLAAGVPVLGRWKVPERRRVLMYVAEGGRIPFTNRLERIAEAYGIAPSTLDGWLEVIYDVAPLNSEVFRDHLTAHLRDFAPGVVHIDPAYSFHPTEVDSRSLNDVGGMLTAPHRLCAEHGASFWVTAHMNQTGVGFGLKRITGAGYGEWADSWALLQHRATPDVDAGRFRLTLALGSRQWGGTMWDLDFDLGRFDADLGLHDGEITWNVQPATLGSGQDDDERAADTLAEVKVELMRAGRKAQKPLAKTAWVERVARRAATGRAAFDELVADGEIVQVGMERPFTFEPVRTP